jgi:hypothetical protein
MHCTRPKILSFQNFVFTSTPNKDSEVVHGYKTTLRKIYKDVGITMEVGEEFGAFVQSTGNFLDPPAMDGRGHMDPITWFRFHGRDSIHLSTLAIRLLSQVASSSSTKRNWSTYGFIHSMKQNRLGALKAGDLLYIHSNFYLLSHSNLQYKKGLISKMWDVELEIFDLNTTLNAMTHLNLFQDVTPPVHPFAIASNILGPPLSIYDVELQYADDEDIDPFQYMYLDGGPIVHYLTSRVLCDETLNFVFIIILFV